MPRLPRDERGFALIGAVWLLLLGAALVAILMLRARTAAVAASQEGVALQRELDLDAAMQTAAADIMINGPRSSWWRIPARGSVTIGNRAIDLAVSSEEGRIDLNETDPVVIQDALQGLGYSGADAQAFLTALGARRGAGRIASTGAIEQMIAPLRRQGNAGICLSDLVTIDSGLNRPDATRAPAVLARALARDIVQGDAQLRPGEAIRMQASAAGGARLSAVMRVGVLGSSPMAVSRWWVATGC